MSLKEETLFRLKKSDRQLMYAIVGLLAVIALIFVFLASPASEKLLGFRINGLFSSANTPSDLYSDGVGRLVTGFPDGDPTGVYLLIDGARRPFPDGETFLCLGYSYDNIEQADKSEYNLPIGEGMKCAADQPHSEGDLIIGLPDSDPTGVFLVENGKLRPFGDGETFLCLGYNHDDIETATKGDYDVPIGEPMTCTPDAGNPDQSLIIGIPDGVPSSVYRIENGTRRPIPDDRTFLCLGYSYNDIVEATSGDYILPVGEPMSCTPVAGHSNGSLLTNFPDSDPTGVFLIENGTRRPFPDEETFLCLGYEYNNLQVANTGDYVLPIGEPMSCDSNANRHADGTLLIGIPNGDPTGVYLVENGKITTICRWRNILMSWI